jgi:hypothetical protein
MKLSKSIFIVFACFSMFFFLGCDGGGSSSGDVGTGVLSASLIDAAGDYRAVYVTVKELQVHRNGDENDESGWQTLEGFSKKTIDLCSLRNGVFEDLGTAELEEGKYSQLRLILCDEDEGPALVDENGDPVYNILENEHPKANYVVFDDDNDTWHMLEVPSAFNTGIKLVKGFEITAGETKEIILDFDANRSVVQAGKSGKWLLRPTIKVLDQTWILDGTVLDDGGIGIEGVLVSVQYPDPAYPEEIVSTSTLTDENGEYVIYVKPPGISGYHIVAYKGPRNVEDGENITGDDILGPECLEITEDEEVLTNNFVLNNSSEDGIGYITGIVTINNGDSDHSATLSFRTNCPKTSKEIEVLSVNIADGSEYRVVLPVGEYSLVASSGEVVNDPVTIKVETDLEKTVDVVIDIPNI